MEGEQKGRQRNLRKGWTWEKAERRGKEGKGMGKEKRKRKENRGGGKDERISRQVKVSRWEGGTIMRWKGKESTKKGTEAESKNEPVVLHVKFQLDWYILSPIPGRKLDKILLF